MSILESAVQNLAHALNALEAKLDEQLAESAGHCDSIDAARRQARAARAHTDDAARELGRAIGEIKALLGEERVSGPE